MIRASAAGLALVAATCVACDPPDSVSADEALEVTCIHARAAFGFVRASGRFVAEPHEVAEVLEIDARLLRAAGDGTAAALVERTADGLRAGTGTSPDIVVYLRDDVTERQRNRIEGRAARLGSVESVRFVPSEEAYERLDATDPEAARATAPDVLPDSFEIVVAEDADLNALRDRLGRRPGVDALDLRTDEAMEPLRMLGDVCELPT